MKKEAKEKTKESEIKVYAFYFKNTEGRHESLRGSRRVASLLWRTDGRTDGRAVEKKILWFCSKFCQMNFRWDKFICISKNRDVIFLNRKKIRFSLKILKFSFKNTSEERPFFPWGLNFGSKTPARRGLFFSRVLNFGPKRQPRGGLFFMRSEFPHPPFTPSQPPTPP